MSDDRRDALQAAINELVRQYDTGEIDSETYVARMIELTGLAQAD